MESHCNDNLRALLEMTEMMQALADKGDLERQDASCGAVFGQLRDTAYKLRGLAEAEMSRHLLRTKVPG
ncbi:MAG: hypothetical protein JEZ07_02330 [Phycisphaerae bacterium]|nr:hypothetical protein [Phycisphaerae bacterium]